MLWAPTRAQLGVLTGDLTDGRNQAMSARLSDHWIRYGARQVGTIAIASGPIHRSFSYLCLLDQSLAYSCWSRQVGDDLISHFSFQPPTPCPRFPHSRRHVEFIRYHHPLRFLPTPRRGHHMTEMLSFGSPINNVDCLHQQQLPASQESQ